MELTITFTEFVLLCWSVLASAAAFKYIDEARHLKRLLIIFIEDEGARAQMLKAHDEFKTHMQNKYGTKP